MKRKTAIILFIAALCLSLLFPPWKEEGQWRNQHTGNLATGQLSRALDHYYFGFLPEYHPVWSQPRPGWDKRGVSIGLRNQDQHQLVSHWLSIDWLAFIIQIPLLALVMAAIRQGSQENAVKSD